MASKKIAAKRLLFSTGIKIYSIVFFLLITTYALLTFIPTPDPYTLSHYHLSASHYRLLVLPIIVFLIAIWLAAFYGSITTKSYAALIKKSVDGLAFDTLASGLMLLAFMMPVTSTLSAIVSLTADHTKGAIAALTIISNYIDLLVMAGAMWLIGDGATRLTNITGARLHRWSEKFWVLVFIIFSSLYGYFIVGQPDRGFDHRVYYMPHWLLLISLAIPYLFFWYVGLKGAAQIFNYRREVRGRLYKSSLRNLSAGITLVIVGSILTRTLTTLSAKLSHLNLTPILVIVYGLLVVIAAGFVLIADGAKRLRQLEEV